MIRTLLEATVFRSTPASAEEWLARTQSHPLSAGEAKALERWLTARPENRDDYARCQQLSQLGDRLKDRADLVRQMPAYTALRRGERIARRRSWPAFVAVAAAGAACAALLLFIVPRMSTDAAPSAIATDHGQRRQATLVDGTRVDVNTDSAVRVLFSDRERRVALDKGEAFFEVTRDAAARPFIVAIGKTEVRVVGTKFSVRASDLRTDVIVAEGKVEVVPDTTQDSPSVPAKVELVPGNSLRFDRRENQVQIAAIDPQRATAWRAGVIDFDNATLPEVIAEVNRYAITQFVIEDNRLDGIRLSGTFKVGDTESVRFALVDGFGVEASLQDNRILLRRSRP